MGWFGSKSGARATGTPSSQIDANKFSVASLKELYDVLSEQSKLKNENPENVVEMVRAIAEIVIYGDQHSAQIIEVFCEKNMMRLLVDLAAWKTPSDELQIQIIQSVSILIQNIKSETTLFYVLSNNHINSLISYPFASENEELMSHFISFLKTLSLKLNDKTIHFFFDSSKGSFPLFTEAVKYFNHSESMVRNAVRTIVLSVLQFDDPAVSAWLLSGPAQAYIGQVVQLAHQNFRRLYLLLLSITHPKKREQKTQKLENLVLRLEVALREAQDHFVYLDEILQLESPGLERIVVDSAMAFLFLPLLLASLIENSKPFCEFGDLDESFIALIDLDLTCLQQVEDQEAGTMLGLLLLSLAFVSFTNVSMLEKVTEAMFGEQGGAHHHSGHTPGKTVPTIEKKYQGQDANEANIAPSTASIHVDDRETGALVANSFKRGGSTTQERGLCGLDRKVLNPVHEAFLRCFEFERERVNLSACCLLFALIKNPHISFGGSLSAEASDGRVEINEKEENEGELLDKSTRVKNPKTTSCQMFWPTDVMDSLIELFHRDPPLTTLMQRVVGKLIIELSEANTTKGWKELSESQLQALNTAYISCVARLKEECFSPSTQEQPSRFVELFEMEWMDLCQGPLSIETLLTNPAIMLPVDMGAPPDASPALKSMMKLDTRQPTSVIEQSRCCVRSFMIVRLLVFALRKSQSSQLATIASPSVVHKENQRIDLRQSDFIKVNVLHAQGAPSPIQPAFMVLAGGSIILVEPEPSGAGRGVTRSIAPLHRVKFATCPDDELVINIEVRLPGSHTLGWGTKQRSSLLTRPQQQALELNHSDELNFGLRASSSWLIVLRFDDHASAYWAHDQLTRAIAATVQAKLGRIRNIVTADV